MTNRFAKRANSPTTEWIGGRIRSPFYITGGKPYRPELIIWLEMPDDLIVAFAIEDPREAPLSLGDSLIEAMRKPLIGQPRKPTRIRVADAAAAREIKRALPTAEIVIAPTPELDQVARLTAQSKPTGKGVPDPSYFGHDGIPIGRIESFFSAAEIIWQMAPWSKAGDNQILRFDIPRLDIVGACLSIIGALGECRGFIIFPSLVAYESFHEAAQAFDADADEYDLGTATLHLDFEAGADLPPSMLREVITHGWPVANSLAYPNIYHRDRDGMLRLLTEEDVRIITACASALATFFVKYDYLFAQETAPEPVCESFYDEDHLEVRITAPYEAGDLFDVNAPAADDLVFRFQHRGGDSALLDSSGMIGRNDPCPCGNGRKLKKCRYGKTPVPERESAETVALPVMSKRLCDAMIRMGAKRFGSDWFHKAEDDIFDPDDAVELASAWTAYHYLIDGKPLVHWFLESERHKLTRRERSWLEAQCEAWLSIWEVVTVESGHGLRCRDLLTHEERDVRDETASKSLKRGDVFLARIVDHEGISLLSGLYPALLPPVIADRVHQRLRKRLRRKTAVPIQRLRDAIIGRFMIRCWEDALIAWDEQLDHLPQLVNQDGELLLLTTDHFDFDPTRIREITSLLEGMDDVVAPKTDNQERIFDFLRETDSARMPTGKLVIGSVVIGNGRLRSETNSVERADALRRRLESELGDGITHHAREHSDSVQAFIPNPRADDESNE